jgi:glucose-1-phosphate thymidylyltransferase
VKKTPGVLKRPFFVMLKLEKAVILARGLGTRLRAENSEAALADDQLEVARAGVKALMPVVDGKTMLDFILERLARAGFSRFCLVIGDEHQAIRDFCQRFDLNITFAVQKEALGTADAVLSALEFCGDDNFLVVNSDNLYPHEDLTALREYGKPALIAYSKKHLIEKSNISEEKINKFATIDFNRDGTLAKITEKPEASDAEARISMNAWVFSPKIFSACGKIEKSVRGEYELSSAVQYAINHLEEKFAAINSNEGVLDLSSRTDIAALREKLLGE